MLRRGGVLVTPVLVAACVAVKVELNESTATAEIRMLRVRIKFLPMFKTLNRSIDAGTSVTPPLLSPQGQKRARKKPSLSAGLFSEIH